MEQKTDLNSSSTDEQLYIDYLSNGSSRSLELLVERYYQNLTFFLYGIVKNKEDAEDIASETFAQLLSREMHFRRESSFKTYLFAIGRNQACIFLRKHKDKTIDLPIAKILAADLIDIYPENQFIQAHEREQLYEVLNQLPKDYRDAVYLVYFENMSYKNAGQVLRKSEKQITNLIYRSKQKLKSLLQNGNSEINFLFK